jgi:Transposase DDE domain
MQFTRFLRNASVTTGEMATSAAEKTAARVAGRHVVAIQDTSELVLGGRRARANGFGPVGKGGALGGLLVHPVLALDATTGAIIGLVDFKIWNRDSGPVTSRRARAIADKESQRWISGTARAGEVLTSAAQITVISDREGDIYEQFANCPGGVDQIARACQNRRIETAPGQSNKSLFPFLDSLPEQDRVTVTLPAAPGRKARTAELAIRFSPVVLRKPVHGAAGLAKTVALYAVDVREVSQPDDGPPVHWRLLTTHRVTTVGEARRIIDLYRMRWTIEEFFRTMKTAGFNIEDADISDPKPMINLVAAATVAAVTIMQLVRARDGTTDQSLTDAFDPTDQRILEATSRRLEGKTARQRNPHRKGTLAFAAWVIARLGGWTGYYGKPGPKVMRLGLHEFQAIKYGTTLRLHDV